MNKELNMILINLVINAEDEYFNKFDNSSLPIKRHTDRIHMRDFQICCREQIDRDWFSILKQGCTTLVLHEPNIGHPLLWDVVK